MLKEITLAKELRTAHLEDFSQHITIAVQANWSNFTSALSKDGVCDNPNSMGSFVATGATS